MEQNVEYRSSSWEAGEGKKIYGYAIVFEQETILHKDRMTGIGYGEIIDRHALDDADMSDVILRYDHKGRVLARTRNGSLKLSVDNHGLYIEADMDGSDEARSFYEDVKNGLICKMSFCFTIADKEIEFKDNIKIRRVKSIARLWDVAIVSFPAYEQTEVYARNAFEAMAEVDRIPYQEAETRKVLLDVEERAAKHGINSDSKLEHFMTREEVERALEYNKHANIFTRRKVDKGEPILRDMLEIRLNLKKVEATNLQEAQELQQRFKSLENELADLREKEAQKRAETIARVEQGEGETIRKFEADTARKDNNMENIEMRAFKKFIAQGTMQNLTTEERAGLTTSGAGAVMPVEIYNRMITNGKYSDLLSRATVLNVSDVGTLKVPVASSNTATWKEELTAVTATSPTLTSIDLGGKELMRVVQYSAAVESMTAEQFTTWMADLCASEVVETLENAFVTGDTDSDAPHDGLQNLTWTPNTNAVEATTAITAADVAKGLSLLPQKYARNAILLMNANTAYNTVGLFKGTSEYAYNLADGAARFMGKEIHISEYCADNEIYIIDPAQLYVRFAKQPVVEVDKSVGFTSATNTMRCLTVVDFAWNTAAAVRVGVAG